MIIRGKTDVGSGGGRTKPGFLTRQSIEARRGWSRWLVPPAALSIHLSIGQAYAWSVFEKPMESGLGISGVQSALPFTMGIVMLGVSAAVFGTAVDTRGPRWAMVVATSCFVSGWLISALGLFLHQYWLVVLGYGFIGGIGLGVGYISPVSTLMKWFPDRPGLATGIAIMGFGGGALIASPVSSKLLSAFGASGSHPDVSGIAKTFLVMGIGYAIFMSLGWLLIRVPAPGWQPAGWDPSMQKTHGLITTANVSAANAIKTRQFWLLWIVLTFNVTAGIGILERAAPIFEDFSRAPPSPRSPPVSSPCSRFSTRAGGSGARRSRTGRAARTCTASTSVWARCSS